MTTGLINVLMEMLVVSHEAPRAEGARAEAKRSGAQTPKTALCWRFVPDYERLVVSHEAERSGGKNPGTALRWRFMPDHERIGSDY